MLTSVIQSDDFRPGMWIITDTVRILNGHNMMGEHIEREDSSYVGVPMKVLAINRPFIIVECHYTNATDRCILNMKEFTFQKVNRSFIKKIKEIQSLSSHSYTTDFGGGIFEPIKKARKK